MKVVHEILHNGVSPNEYSRIPHKICPDDFNTNHPNSSRISRIASEIGEYLKYKRKNAEV